MSVCLSRSRNLLKMEWTKGVKISLVKSVIASYQWGIQNCGGRKTAKVSRQTQSDSHGNEAPQDPNGAGSEEVLEIMHFVQHFHLVIKIRQSNR